MLKTLAQNIEIMSCSGDSGVHGIAADMKGERSLADATAAVCWQRFKNKNPEPQHMFQAVLRDFMTHPSRSGINTIFIYLFLFCSLLPSPPLHSVKCGIIYSTPQRRADGFSISI